MIDRPSDGALKHFIFWVKQLQTKTANVKKIDIFKHCLFSRDNAETQNEILVFARDTIIFCKDPILDTNGAIAMKEALSNFLQLGSSGETAVSFALGMLSDLADDHFEVTLG